MDAGTYPSLIQNITIQSYVFISKKWLHTEKTNEPDKGFQRAFMNYMVGSNLFRSGSVYCTQDFGKGLETLSKVEHELDFIGWTENNICVFELKLYEVADLPKDMILSFYHKVLDFYLRNLSFFKGQRIYLMLPTRYAPIDDSMRMLCFSLGIELIDTELYPVRLIEYYTLEMWAQSDNLPTERSKPLQNLALQARRLVQESSFSISDFFTLDSKEQIIFTPIITSPDSLVRRHRELDAKFRLTKESFRSRHNVIRARCLVPVLCVEVCW